MSSDPLSEAVFVSFRALGTEVDRLDQAAADRFGLIRTDMRALDIISSSGPLAPTALAGRLGFTTGGVTSVLDRLERAGYVRRRIDPSDRRRQLIEATETAAAREREVFGGLIRATRRLLGTYSEDQLVTIRTSSSAPANSPVPTPTASPVTRNHQLPKPVRQLHAPARRARDHRRPDAGGARRNESVGRAARLVRRSEQPQPGGG